MKTISKLTAIFSVAVALLVNSACSNGLFNKKEDVKYVTARLNLVADDFVSRTITGYIPSEEDLDIGEWDIVFSDGIDDVEFIWEDDNLFKVPEGYYTIIATKEVEYQKEIDGVKQTITTVLTGSIEYNFVYGGNIIPEISIPVGLKKQAKCPSFKYKIILSNDYEKEDVNFYAKLIPLSGLGEPVNLTVLVSDDYYISEFDVLAEAEIKSGYYKLEITYKLKDSEQIYKFILNDDIVELADGVPVVGSMNVSNSAPIIYVIAAENPAEYAGYNGCTPSYPMNFDDAFDYVSKLDKSLFQKVVLSFGDYPNVPSKLKMNIAKLKTGVDIFFNECGFFIDHNGVISSESESIYKPIQVYYEKTSENDLDTPVVTIGENIRVNLYIDDGNPDGVPVKVVFNQTEYNFENPKIYISEAQALKYLETPLAEFNCEEYCGPQLTVYNSDSPSGPGFMTCFDVPLEENPNYYEGYVIPLGPSAAPETITATYKENAITSGEYFDYSDEYPIIKASVSGIYKKYIWISDYNYIIKSSNDSSIEYDMSKWGSDSLHCVCIKEDGTFAFGSFEFVINLLGLYIDANHDSFILFNGDGSLKKGRGLWFDRVLADEEISNEDERKPIFSFERTAAEPSESKYEYTKTVSGISLDSKDYIYDSESDTYTYSEDGKDYIYKKYSGMKDYENDLLSNNSYSSLFKIYDYYVISDTTTDVSETVYSGKVYSKENIQDLVEVVNSNNGITLIFVDTDISVPAGTPGTGTDNLSYIVFNKNVFITGKDYDGGKPHTINTKEAGLRVIELNPTINTAKNMYLKDITLIGGDLTQDADKTQTKGGVVLLNASVSGMGVSLFEGTTLSGGKAYSGGGLGIDVNNQTWSYMYDGAVINGCEAVENGGAIYQSNSNNYFDVKGGIIGASSSSDKENVNKAEKGAGIFGGRIDVENANIQYNQATVAGGGIYIDYDATISGGTIIGNKGGGIYFKHSYSSGKLEITGGQIGSVEEGKKNLRGDNIGNDLYFEKYSETDTTTLSTIFGETEITSVFPAYVGESSSDSIVIM